MIYGNQEVVDKKIEELKGLNRDQLLTELVLVKAKLDNNELSMRNCKSDFSYWGLVAIEEELNAIKIYIEDEIKDYLIENKAKFVSNAELTKQRLNTLIDRKNEVINNLNEYKPNGYKRIIEFINKIFSEE